MCKYFSFSNLASLNWKDKFALLLFEKINSNKFKQ